ncbi:MAG: hypothetical protein IJQ71_07510 [Clostridia bacterium]|nr:hypothetical protein [Clostridia bacterium]
MKTLPESQKVCFFSPAVQFFPVHPRRFSGSFHSVQRILTQTAKALNTSVSGRSVYTGESTKVLHKTKNNEARRAEREKNKMKNNMKEINMKELSVKTSFTSRAGPTAKETYSKQASERQKL